MRVPPPPVPVTLLSALPFAGVLATFVLTGLASALSHFAPFEPPASVCVSRVVTASGSLSTLRPKLEQQCPLGTLAWAEYNPVLGTADALCICNERLPSANGRIARYDARKE